MTRTEERITFLTDLFTDAIDHGGYGWFIVDQYSGENMCATIRDTVTSTVHHVSIDTIATGLRVIRDSTLAVVDGHTVRVNAQGERLYFGGDARRELMLADRTNGEDGDYDVVGALAVLECGLFGSVVYA